jgi:hypothetical protein
LVAHKNVFKLDRDIAKRQGLRCLLGCEPLGTDYGDAKKRCDELLNPQFDAWRKRESTVWCRRLFLTPLLPAPEYCLTSQHRNAIEHLTDFTAKLPVG